MEKQKIERPLGLKLILLYNIILIISIIYSMAAGYGGFVGILFLIALYEGLWKMKRGWMDAFCFFVGISTILNFYLFYLSLAYDAPIETIYYISILLLNVVSIYWLLNNRNIFIEKTKEEKEKEKRDDIKILIAIVGMFGIALITIILSPDYILYSLVVMLLWGFFAWFGLPRIFKGKI